MAKKSLDRSLENSDEQFNSLKNPVKEKFINIYTGFFIGMVGGLYLGEFFNNHLDILKQAPETIKDIVDLTSMYICGRFGAKLPWVYKIFKN